MEEQLLNLKEIGWKGLNKNEKSIIFDFCQGYMDFLNRSKIEREFVTNAVEKAEQNGFKDISTFQSLKPGDKVYFVNRDKSMY